MADPTLEDVLDAIATLTAQVGAVKDDVGGVRQDLRGVEARLEKLETKVGRLETTVEKLGTKVERLDVKVDVVREGVSAHRRETAKGFADLDRELAGAPSRSIESSRRDIAALRKLVTAKKTARPVPRRPRRG